MIKRTVLILGVLAMVLLPGRAWGGMNLSLEEPFSSFASNSVGDIVHMELPGGGGIIWVGTGNGLSKTTDGGASWLTYNQARGLNHNDISALAVSGTTLWVATAYGRVLEGELIPYGRGFNRTADFGDTWDSFIPQQVDFAGMIAYDIAIDDTTVWAAAWYGGLIRSQDGGQTWENVFVDSASQADFEEGRFQYLNNRFFAVVVDTSCPVRKKLKNSINDIHYDKKIIWAATQNGLQGSLDMGESWFPKDTLLGLNSNGVYCLGGDTSFFWVGLYQSEDIDPFYDYLPTLTLTGADFNYTTDKGFTWTSSRPDQGQASSLNKFPLDIALADTVVWAACAEGGLIRSFDRGINWENVFTDTSAQRRFEEDVLQDRDVFTSLATDTSVADTTLVWAGTKNGIYKFVYTTSDIADTVFRYLYDTSKGEASGLIEGRPVILAIGIQNYDDNRVIWAGGYLNLADGVFYPVTYKSTDGGNTWSDCTPIDMALVLDFAFVDSIVWAASKEGLKRSTDGGLHWRTFDIIDSTSGQKIIPSAFTSVCAVQDTADTMIFVGSTDGLVRSTDDGVTWNVTKFAHSFKKAIWAGSAAGIYKFIYNYRDDFDTVLNYNSYLHNITGDWVVSLAIHQYDGKKVIWGGTQPTYSGGHGASFSTDDGDTWSATLLGDRVWNFAFEDTVIWTATSSGLKSSDNWGDTWEVFNYMKDTDEITENRIFSTEFSSVAIIDGDVWAGNSDGLVKSQDGGISWKVIRMAVPIGSKGSETAYAYPSPFSPIVEGGQVARIHHKPRQDGSVTIKIYDFAMNLVITLVDGQQRLGGVEYDEPWDGKNEKSDLVANGVYFFKVEAPGGQSEWGKLVVLK